MTEDPSTTTETKADTPLPATAAPVEAILPNESATVQPAGPQMPQPPFPEEVSVNELQTRPIGALQKLALELGWRVNGSRGKHQLIHEIISWMG